MCRQKVGPLICVSFLRCGSTSAVEVCPQPLCRTQCAAVVVLLWHSVTVDAVITIVREVALHILRNNNIVCSTIAIG
jgi:hypothetical protein